ncbi:hypothetical protein [Microbacterium sp. SY138]|uniref:hypothetical protein n=1 Tax=Microbacterium sp. SY138 TaxID=3149040 RepID=UPI00321B9A74
MQRSASRRMWWFIAGGVILAVLLVVAFQAFRGSTLARQDMAAHLTFPATYQGFQEASETAAFILNEDGTAEVSALMLGSGERKLDDGRVCLDGDVIPVTGKASWRTDDAGGVVIEAGERLTRFSQDDPLNGEAPSVETIRTWKATAVTEPVNAPRVDDDQKRANAGTRSTSIGLSCIAASLPFSSSYASAVRVPCENGGASTATRSVVRRRADGGATRLRFGRGRAG